MHHDQVFKGILFSMTLVGIGFAIDAGAQESEAGNVPEQPCENAQTVTACKVHEDDAVMDCGPETLCSDPGDVESSGWSTFVGESGETIATNWCTSITGSYDDDTIRIGAIYYWYAPLQLWYTYGDFGYCKNGVLTVCDATTNPLPVKPYEGDDTVGTVSSVYTCVYQLTAIGPWSSLDSVWQGIKLSVYGCRGWDDIYGTPNDDLLIGGSDYDKIYARGGNDNVCGDYGTTDCTFCNSGNNCTSGVGPDSGSPTSLDDLYGEGGNDTICGHGGNDWILGGEDNDFIYGQGGCDRLYGENGNDTIYTANFMPVNTGNEPGSDDGCTSYNWAIGGQGSDEMHGSNRADQMKSGGENGYMFGYGGSDKICSQAMNTGDPWAGNRISGGSGTDVVLLCLSDGEGAAFYAYGGEGNADTVCFLGGYWLGHNVELNGDHPDAPDGSNDCCDCGGFTNCAFIPSTCEVTSCSSLCQPADFSCVCL